MQTNYRNQPSLRWRLVRIVLICWILPVIIIMVVMNDFTRSSLNEQTIASYTSSVQTNAEISVDRLDNAVQASRAVAYIGNIKNYYREYQRSGRQFSDLYRSVDNFLRMQYRSDNRFRMSVIWFWDDPQAMSCNAYNGSVGASYEELDSYWRNDHAAVTAVTEDLDTGIALLNCGGRIYMVRNIMAGDLTPIATLVLSLNEQYFFGNFETLPGQDGTVLYMDNIELPISGQLVPGMGEVPVAADGIAAYHANTQEPYISGRCAGDGYTLSYVVKVSTQGSQRQMKAFQAMLVGMSLILLPLMLLVVNFFYKNVSKPVEQLVAGAREIELGNFGVQLPHSALNREFAYLEGSFNEMSLQLEELFHRIYDEELALRDAKLKALQSQINPHFLNNTLELINWEARMSGNIKVTRMIEALSTMLDAAMARDSRHTVRLSEEMMYVDAYLYIISERLGKRLTITKEIGNDLLGCMVPRLIMQPIIENAVEHGITPRQQGNITLRAACEDSWLLLQVINDGSMSEQDEQAVAALLEDTGERPSGSSRIGISNVHQRLRMTYGTGSGLSIVQGEGGFVIATIKIPLDRCSNM